VVADLKTRATWCEFWFLKLVAQMTDKLFRDLVEMSYRLKAQMMIALQLFHRFLAIGELRFNDQRSVLDLRALGAPALTVELPIKIIGVNELSVLKQFRFESRFLCAEIHAERDQEDKRALFGFVLHRLVKSIVEAKK